MTMDRPVVGGVSNRATGERQSSHVRSFHRRPVGGRQLIVITTTVIEITNRILLHRDRLSRQLGKEEESLAMKLEKSNDRT